MSGHQGVVTDEMKEKISAIAASLKQLWDDAKKKNKDDPNTDLAGKAYFASQKIADALTVGVTPVEEFDKAAKALPALIKKAKEAAAGVKEADGKADEDDEAEGKVVYANTAVKSACHDAKTQTKIQSILLAGPTYTGKSTPYLRAWHDHVDNKSAVAFKWKKNNLEIVAYGTKPAPTSIQGDGGYKWVQQ